MRLISIIIGVVLVTLTVNTTAFAGGSRAEAKALVVKAAAFIRENGTEKAFAEFDNGKGMFVDRDLYIFASDFDGKILAHGGNSKLIGKSMIELQDADGNYLIKGLISTAKKGSGWYEYKWSNPQTKKIQKKATYVQKINDTLWIACGIYL